MLVQFQDDDRTFQLMQNSWAAELNPIIQKVNNTLDYFVFTSSQDGISNATYTSVSGCLFRNLLAGLYIFDFGGQFEAANSVAPTSARGDYALFNEGGIIISMTATTALANMQSGDFYGMASAREQIRWGGGLLQLQGKITIVGGTITSRNLRRTWIRATKVQEN